MSQDFFTILSVLLGSTNILSLVMWRVEKRKAVADASNSEADVKRKNYELVRDQADNLMDNLDKVQREYMELQQQIRDQSTKYTEEILDKCRTIAELKSQLIYFKGLRCYKSVCPNRISKKPEDGNHQATIKGNNA